VNKKEEKKMRRFQRALIMSGCLMVSVMFLSTNIYAYTHPFHMGVADLTVRMMGKKNEYAWLNDKKTMQNILDGSIQPDKDRGHKFWLNPDHKHNPKMVTENYTDSIKRFETHAKKKNCLEAQRDGSRIMAKAFHFYADQSEPTLDLNKFKSLMGQYPRQFAENAERKVKVYFDNRTQISNLRKFEDRVLQHMMIYKRDGFTPRSEAQVGTVINNLETELRNKVNSELSKAEALIKKLATEVKDKIQAERLKNTIKAEAKKQIMLAYDEYIERVVALQNITIELFHKEVASYRKACEQSTIPPSGTPGVGRHPMTGQPITVRQPPRCERVCVQWTEKWLNVSDGRHSLCEGGVPRPPGPGLRPPKCELARYCVKSETRCK
jgi:hypothetical protein